MQQQNNPLHHLELYIAYIHSTFILPEVFRYRNTIVLLALPRPALLGKLVVSIVYMLTLLYFIIACCYNGHLQMIAGICNQLRQLQQQHGTFSHWARASSARCPWQQGGLPRSPARGVRVYQSYKTQHSVPINKCVPSWAVVEGEGRDTGLNPWQLARERGCEAEGGRRRTQRGLSIYATVRWTLLLLTISCWCGKVDSEGCVREGGERRRKGRKGELEGQSGTRIEKNSARIFHVLYIYSNQWTVECTNEKGRGNKKRRKQQQKQGGCKGEGEKAARRTLWMHKPLANLRIAHTPRCVCALVEA